MRDEVRRTVGAGRRPPGLHERWFVRADGTRTVEGWREGSPPAEIWVETACAECQSAGRALPAWLGSEAQRWMDEPILLGVVSTAGWLPCDRMWQFVAEVRAAAPAWRTVLRTDGSGMAGMSMIHRVLSGPFDEVRFSCVRADPRADRPNERALTAIKQLIELRQARGLERPVVAWLCEAGGSSSSDRQALRAARSTARQIGVDRFEVVEPAPRAAP